METTAAEAVKEPEVAEAAIASVAGTVRLALLLVRAITNPPEGAATLNATVHALVPGPVNDAGLHVRLLTVTVALRVRVEVTLAPFAAAVIVAVPLVETVPAVA